MALGTCAAGQSAYTATRPWKSVRIASGRSQQQHRRCRLAVVRATWDPEGLLPPSSGGHFARREREKLVTKLVDADDQFQNEAKSLLEAALGATRPNRHIPERWQVKGGIPASDATAYDKEAFRQQMKEVFMPVDLDLPGLRIQHLDPPVFTIEGFFSPEQCQEVIEAALEGGQLQASKIGAGNANALTASNTYHSRRTSMGMVIEHSPVFRSRHPRLAAMADVFQRKGLALFGAGEGREWATPGKLPAPGQYAYEGLQVTRYEQGQHFLAHEDAFPLVMARQNKFNRHATLLLYLNTCAEGGATRFDQLNLEVQPQQGTAVLFFPAFADGSPDARTLHTAAAAAEGHVKWVCQQWVARGLSPTAPSAAASALLPTAGAAGAAAGTAGAAGKAVGADDGAAQAVELLESSRRSSKGKGKSKKAAPAPSRGFGRK